MERKYKVKLLSGRLLGPLDMERVQALVKKGHITGPEATAVEPFTEWSAFASFPELAELLEGKREADKKRHAAPAPTPAPSPSPVPPVKQAVPSEEKKPETKNIDPTAMPTATMEQKITFAKIPELEGFTGRIVVDEEPPANYAGELQMPTLLDVKQLPRIQEQERTMLGLLIPRPESTQMINAGELNKVLQKVHAAEVATEDAKKRAAPTPEPAKKPLLSPRTSVILAIGLLIIGFLTQLGDQDKDATEKFELSPRVVSFPFVGVSTPVLVGKVPDPRAAMDLLEEGMPLLEKSTPLGLIDAATKYFFPAAQKNPKSLLARSLLATTYIRLAEIIPRDEYLFETLKKLLYPAPAPAQYIPEYVVARVEYMILLQRFDQALEFVDDYLHRVQTPEILYQKARLHYERSEIDLALTTVNRAIKASLPERVSPRHRLLLAELLTLKKSDAAVQEAKLLLSKAPKFGPGLLFGARLCVQSNKFQAALKILRTILENPMMLDRLALAEAFLLTARALDGTKQIRRALEFAEMAKLFLPEKEEVENQIFRLRAKLAETKKTFELIMAGRRYEKEKTFDKAENQYVLARESSNVSAVPLILWARLLEKKGESAQAVDRYKRALQINPQSQEAALKLAELYIKRYDFEPGKEMLEHAKLLKRDLDEVDYWHGYIMRKLGKYEQSETYYKKAISQSSRFPDVYIAMGAIEADRKNRELAEFYYAMALRYDPVNAHALLGAALARFHLESPSMAVAFLKDKLNSQPNSAAIMTNLAVIYRYSGDKDSTKNYLQNAMRSDPTYAEAFRQIGDLAREEAESYSDNYVAKENNYRFALASYEGYSKLAPHDPEGYMSTAELYFYVRDYGAAAKNYYKVLGLAPNYPGVRLRLSRISLNGKDTVKALELVNEELKRYPKSADAHLEMGKIFMAQAIGFAKASDRAQADKKYSDAATAFTTAATDQANNVAAIYFLGYVNLERGNYDAAQTLLERAKKMEPLSPDVHLQLGRLYMRKRYTQKAITAFTDAKNLTQDPEKLQEINEAMRGK